MPTIDLADIWTVEGRLRSQAVIASIMAWPNDPERRNQYITTLTAEMLGSDWIMKSRSSGGDEIVVNRDDLPGLATWFEQSGGYSAVARAPGLGAYKPLFTKHHQGWRVAGLVMSFMKAMSEHHADELRGGPSINKAMRLIEHLQDGMLIPKNSKYHRDAWNNYRTTAHLCAAYVYITHPLINDFYAGKLSAETLRQALEGHMWQSFDQFLAVAHDFQQFGLEYPLPRTRCFETLLPPGSIWSLPSIVQRKPVKAKVKPLPPDLLELLMQKTSYY
jgi:hypothetical protein